MQETLLLSDVVAPAPRHPVVGTQKDIRYYGSTAKGVLNSPDTTGMPFWSINPYVGCAFGCAYCYARFAHRFVMERAVAAAEADSPLTDDLTELPPWLAFERRIFVKRNAAEVLRKTLRERGTSAAGAVQRGEPIVIGTATDPYQPAERHFRVTRSVLEVLAEARRLRLTIITKSPLITRDVDLLAQIAKRSSIRVHMSLITLDRDLARRIEPRSPTPESRLRAVRRLRQAGIDVGVNIMPVLPGITDRPDALTALVKRIAAEGATHINPAALRLRSSARKRYLPFLATEFPSLAERYAAAYANEHEMPPAYREGLAKFMKRVCADAGIQYGSSYDRDERGRQLEPTLGPEYEEGSSPVPAAPLPAPGIPQLEFIL
ncbi:MAG: radical SAM protein [Cytophagaceae bacterium]|nr:radical SAM protein [Gemmatimonadaceae bacterium]